MRLRGIVLHTVGVRGDTTMAAIRAYHTTPDDPKTKVVEGNGWADNGYHFGVRKDGRVETGRPLTRAGSHLQGANDTIGIVVTGAGDHEPWTTAQWESVASVCAELCVAHGWTAEQVRGHREGPAYFGAKPTAKTCPGLLVDMDLVRSAVTLALMMRK